MTDTNVTDLVSRLRADARWRARYSVGSGISSEAAEALEAQAATIAVRARQIDYLDQQNELHASIAEKALIRAEAAEARVKVLEEALTNSLDTLEDFLSTFGDLGDRVTAADINDWRGALTTEAKDA